MGGTDNHHNNKEVKGLTKIFYDVAHSEDEIVVHAKFHVC